MYDEDFTITPFDPGAGIKFKYGRIYTDRDRQITEFQNATGYLLPSDFLEMIGEWCEGGFDGHYRVYFKDGVEVQWHHLLLMKLADEHDMAGHDALKLIRAQPKLFGHPPDLRLFPFGEACEFRSPVEMTKGYLAFNASQGNGVVFVAEGSGRQRDIADSFRAMLLGSDFVFYG
ncbi:MAG TPA: hypothetical protein VH475_12695 [Tepidisphaeraceae bacterium]|jgi:hypothetical protein